MNESSGQVDALLAGDAATKARYQICGPDADSTAVQAWGYQYIPFENLPDWQQRLRDEIRRRCRQLEPSGDAVLHATYFGEKRPRADIENLLIYNIDSFKESGKNGIRFEHGAAVPPAPDGTVYPVGYCYAIEPRTCDFSHWQRGQSLAAFDWINLDGFEGEKKLAKVWLALSRALRRGQVELSDQALPETPFALRIEISTPQGRRQVWGSLFKAVFDGAICAFQAHTDTGTVDEVAARLSNYLPEEPEEIMSLLLDQHGAVLGAVPQLVSVYRSGVKWDPTDHWCLAGELLPAVTDGPIDSRWALRGDLFALSR